MSQGFQFTCSDILKATGGRLVRGDREASFLGLSTDSRTLKGGEIFLTLKGERFDGHAFVREALGKGVAGAVVQNGHFKSALAAAVESQPIIAVPETLRALGDVARFWRNKFSLPVIGITGSNGKTSTKEMISFLLEKRYRVLRSHGTFNNLVGLPLTLLSLKPSHEIAVLEMGTNIPGEIKRLAEIARPTVGVITNIGRAHLEGMGSLEVLIREKGELFRAVGEKGVVAVNTNDPHVLGLARECPARKIRFGLDREADVMVDHIEWRGADGVRFRLTVGAESAVVDFPLFGLQFVHNVATAAAIASLFEMTVADIKERLQRFKPPPMRMEIIRLRGIVLINDTYNANPPSVEMALKSFSQVIGGGRAFVVMGDMLELGDIAQEAHREVGRLIGNLNVAGLFVLGDHAADVAEGAVEAKVNPQEILIAGSHREIVDHLIDTVQPGDWILVKGSRKMRMETVIDAFRKRA